MIYIMRAKSVVSDGNGLVEKQLMLMQNNIAYAASLVRHYSRFHRSLKFTVLDGAGMQSFDPGRTVRAPMRFQATASPNQI